VTLVADSLNGKTDTTDTNNAQITNFGQPTTPAPLPGSLSTPLGQIAFTAALGQNGLTETFSLYVDPALGVNGYWAQDKSGTWVNLASAPYGGQIVTEGNKIRLDFKITDGGVFDTDGLVNGSVSHTGLAGNMTLSIVGQPADLVPGDAIFFT
jgi:hypothetical protein